MLTFYLTQFFDILFDIDSDILSDIDSDILFNINSDILLTYLRSGGGHCRRELAVEVRVGTLLSGACS